MPLQFCATPRSDLSCDIPRGRKNGRNIQAPSCLGEWGITKKPFTNPKFPLPLWSRVREGRVCPSGWELPH